MRSRTGYWLAPIPLVAGLALAGWLVWSGIAALQNALVRVVVPGTIELTLDEPGTYTIFYETDSVVDGKLYSAANIAGLSVSVTEEANSQAIAVTVPGFSSSYAIGGHSGKSCWPSTSPSPAAIASAPRIPAAGPGRRPCSPSVAAFSAGWSARSSARSVWSLPVSSRR
jgi:hypothetical protein